MLLPAILGVGCGSGTNTVEITPELSGCTAGMAQISIQDGFSRRLCGCQETGSDPILPPAALTCTVSRGTVVFFHFYGTRLAHQIASVGTPSFPASPLADSLAIEPVLTHSVSLGQAGTYQFNDLIDQTITGSIIVQ
jgi:hypothetical protein